MSRNKYKKRSGRVWPKILDKENAHLVTWFWDDWADWRDGLRWGRFATCWKDKYKKRKQWM